MEWKLFEGEAPEFASAEWYEDREAANHIDELGHRERLQEVAALVANVVGEFESRDLASSTGEGVTLSDLGGGDGGFLQFLKRGLPHIQAWGYDLAPANVHFAGVRGVDIRLIDFANSKVEYGDITVLAETLEHLEDPHGTLKNIPSPFVIASCPWHETDEQHYEFHLWAWDFDGYRKLFEDAGWKVIEHYIEGMSQFVLATRGWEIVQSQVEA